MKVSAILLLAGKGSRFGKPKQFVEVFGKKLYEFSLFNLKEFADEIVLVVPAENLNEFQTNYPDFVVVEGGSERYISSYNGIKASSGDVVLIHDSARPLLSKELISGILNELESYPAVVPYIPVSDTLRNIHTNETVDRSSMGLIQTPQGFWKSEILKAYESIESFENITDDAEVYIRYGGSIRFVRGEKLNFKITYREDLEMFKSLLMRNVRVGYGYDVHPLVKGRKLILGGVNITSEFGALGHSDGDALIHSLIDAILGALGEGNIGMLFPDTSENYRNIYSLELLKEVYERFLKDKLILNVDITVIIERPKLMPYIDQMRRNIARILKVDEKLVSIKPKSGNNFSKGFVQSHAVVLILHNSGV